MIKKTNESKQISEMDWNNIHQRLANDKRPYARRMGKKVANYMDSDEYNNIYGNGIPTPKNIIELKELINAEIEQMNNGHLDLTHFDVSRLDTLERMFVDVENKSKIKSLDVSGWDVSKASGEFSHVFYNLPECKEINVSGWKINPHVDSFYSMFRDCTKLERIIGLEDWDVSNIADFTNLFSGCKSLKVAPISKWTTKHLESTEDMFYNCESLVEPNISNIDFVHVNTLYGMFYNCRSLRTLDCSTMDTQHVEKFDYMFGDCVNLQSLPGIENWNVNCGLDFEGMFKDCKKLRCDISSWTIQRDATKKRMLKGTRNIECDWENAEDLLESRKSWLNYKKKIIESGEIR